KGWVIGPIEPDDLPANIDDALRSSFREIDKETDAVLTNAAAIGPEFALRLLQHLTGKREGELLEFLDRAARAQIVKFTGDDHHAIDRIEFMAPRKQELKRDSSDEKTVKEIHS